MTTHERAQWLNSLQVGDVVLAGVGYEAQLRSTPSEPAADKSGVVVRCLNRAEDGTWWGYHHARVAVSTLQPWPKDTPRPDFTKKGASL